MAALTPVPLDNLTSSAITAGGTARTLVHNINAATNRIDSTTGTAAYAFNYAYDAQGNITQRGNKAYTFDQGNRMKSAVGTATYTYDGLGHRVSVVGTDGVNRVQVYTQAGQMLYIGATGGNGTKYIYLDRHVLAEVGPTGTQYGHNDALGSPVARTDASRNVISRTRYESYGLTASGTAPTIGFTGHVNDADTGLIYMQQRYYDPVAGRFLSIDPVITDANSGSSFNRYYYAESNPYRYVDPDGRQSLSGNMPTYSPVAQLEMGVRVFYGQLVEKTTAVLTVASMAVGTPGPAVAKESIVVTQATIQAALKGSPMSTAQSAVSLPAVANYVQKIEAGMVAPAIKVDGKIIVEGNHRYVAGRLAGKEPAQTAGTASPSQVSQAKPIEKIKVDPTDWGNR